MAKIAVLKLSGAVYCDWNAFSFVRPTPERLLAGDLIIWSWSGNSRKPKSKENEGLFAVSVFTGKRRAKLKVKHTRVNRFLHFRDGRDRESQLGALVRELEALAGREVRLTVGGFEIAPMPATKTEVSPVSAPAPQSKAPSAAMTASRGGKTAPLSPAPKQRKRRTKPADPRQGKLF